VKDVHPETQAQQKFLFITPRFIRGVYFAHECVTTHIEFEGAEVSHGIGNKIENFDALSRLL